MAIGFKISSMRKSIVKNTFFCSLLFLISCLIAVNTNAQQDQDPKKQKKGGEEKKSYANKSAHVELAERMRKRDPATAPHVGD